MLITTRTCAGPCSKRARDAQVAFHQAQAQHVDAMVAWLRTGPDERGPVPAPPQQPVVYVEDGEPAFGPRCAQLIRSALVELDDLASLLQANADGHRPGADRSQKTTTTKSKPSPSPIVDTLDELYGDLIEVEDHWRDFRGYPARPQRQRGSHARTVTLAWLRDHLDEILSHPWSVGFGLRMLAWQRRLRTMSKSDPASKSSPIRCPRCSERQVKRRDDGYFECNCGRLLTQAEHDREHTEQADELQEANA